jgi:ATP-dependent exoDNAse (exonuclease V) alpha subunit
LKTPAGRDHLVESERGAKPSARGDRLYFLRNERSFGAKNGSLGTIEATRGRTLDHQHALALGGPEEELDI